MPRSLARLLVILALASVPTLTLTGCFKNDHVSVHSKDKGKKSDPAKDALKDDDQ